MKSLLVKALAPLGSLAFQERHVVRWSASDDYRLPRELVDGALLKLELVLTTQSVGPPLDAQERAALARCHELLHSYVDAIGFDAIDAEELIHQNEDWQAIRDLAAETLGALGASLSDWERVNLPASGFLLIRTAPALSVERFSPEQFQSAPAPERALLCAELESELSTRLRDSGDFAEVAAQITAELWATGHDLWNVHRNDERELWAPDSATSPDAMGISVELYRSGRARVS